MNIILYIIGGIIALFVIKSLVKLALGGLVSPNITGKAFLKAELKKSGINAKELNDEFIDSVVNQTLSVSKFVGHNSTNISFHENFVKYLENDAVRIAFWFNSPEQKSEDINSHRKYEDPLISLLLKYHP